MGDATHAHVEHQWLAARATGDIETTDMTVLRRLLKNTYPLGKVRAATRVLAITR